MLLWQDFTGSWKWKIWLPLCPWGSVALRTYPHVGLGGPRFPAAASPLLYACSSPGLCHLPCLLLFTHGSFSLGYFCLCRFSRGRWALGTQAQLGKKAFPSTTRGPLL